MSVHRNHCKICHNALVSRSHVGIRFYQRLAYFNSSTAGGNVQGGASPNKTGNQGCILETHAGDGIVPFVYRVDVGIVMQQQLGYVRLSVIVAVQQRAAFPNKK